MAEVFHGGSPLSVTVGEHTLTAWTSMSGAGGGIMVCVGGAEHPISDWEDNGRDYICELLHGDDDHSDHDIDMDAVKDVLNSDTRAEAKRKAGRLIDDHFDSHDHNEHSEQVEELYETLSTTLEYVRTMVAPHRRSR